MAAYPLELWDVNGAQLMGAGSRVARQMGEFDTGTGNGSVYIEVLANPESWFVCTSLSDGVNVPMVIRSGGTVSWRFIVNANAPNTSVRVIYGLK